MKLAVKSADNPFYMILHPFDASYDIRRKEKGSFITALTILALWFFVSVMQRQNMGYIFNQNKLSQLNIFLILAKVFIPFAMWICGNWVISILMNGTGRFRDIFILSTYSLLPHMIGTFLAVLLSNVLAWNEPFASYASIFGTAWSFIVLFIGTMVIHEYQFLENIASCLFSVCVMAVILFLLMLLGSLFTEFWGFLQTVYRELLFRL